MSFPDILTHNYDPARGPFRNLCELPEPEAEEILAAMRRSGARSPSSNYLRRRLAVEDWLIRESRRKIGGITKGRPIYFFLGDFADGRDPSRPRSFTLPLRLFSPDTITFTYPDSMASLPLATDPALAPQRRDHHGRVMTLAEIMTVVARVGLPVPRWPRQSGELSDGFIEVQIWDDGPLRPYKISGAP